MPVDWRQSLRKLFTRPRFAWSVLLVCLAAATWAVGWLTLAAWRSDQTRQHALLDSEIRNALWRLDSLAAPLLAIESNRPSLSSSFTGTPVLASRLIRGYVVRDPAGCWTIRREPRSMETEPLPDDSDFLRVDWNSLLESVVGTPDSTDPANPEMATGVNTFDGLIDWPNTLSNYLSNSANNDPGGRGANLRNSVDPQQQVSRSRVVQQVQQMAQQPMREARSAASELRPLRPLWVNGELVLARQSSVGKGASACRLEICWLNWPEWSRLLAEQVETSTVPLKLIPGDRSSPTEPVNAADDWRMVSLPIRLEPQAPIAADSWPLPFVGVWALLVVVGLAFVALMRQTIALSERRAAFVSAVTHELRTPLTTFRLYTEMLSDGVASDPVQQQTYFDTLTREANRLTHLVENVLAYARLEHGRPTARNETLAVGELIERCWPRLEQRVAETSLKLALEIDEVTGNCRITTNALAIEQILFNLIDNSCKYARDAVDPRIICRITREQAGIVFRVTDFGPGLSATAQRTVFQPFRKSSAQAADSAPGIGLGLSLCQRLAVELRGSIRHAANSPTGLCIEVRLPAS